MGGPGPGQLRPDLDFEGLGTPYRVGRVGVGRNDPTHIYILYQPDFESIASGRPLQSVAMIRTSKFIHFHLNIHILLVFGQTLQSLT